MEFILLLIIIMLGTYAARTIPLLLDMRQWLQKRGLQTHDSPWLATYFKLMGPATIAALLGISLPGLFTETTNSHNQILHILLAIMTVIVSYASWKHAGLSVLLGVTSFALLLLI